MNDRSPPHVGARGPQGGRHPADLSPVEVWFLDLMRALADPWSRRILIATAVRPVSATMFIREWGAEPDRVYSRFRRLARDGFLEQVGERREPGRRGGAQRLYRSTVLSHLDAAAWREMPPLVREVIWAFCLERLEAALCADVKDRRLAVRHVTLDRESLAILDRRLTRLRESLPAIAAEAAMRMQASGGEPVPVTVWLFALPGHHGAPAHGSS